MCTYMTESFVTEAQEIEKYFVQGFVNSHDVPARYNYLPPC